MKDYSFMVGQKYGRWTVQEFGERIDNHKAAICRCECGNIRNVIVRDLLKGNSKSCGCLHSKIMRELKTTLKHGYANNEKLYAVWRTMKQRCYNKKSKMYYRYGGRGIKVCQEWYDYVNFRKWAYDNGYGEGLQIDRIDVDGNYEPSNCRWVNSFVNSDNRSNVRHHVINGKEYNEAQLTRELSLPKDYIGKNIRNGKKIAGIENGKIIWEQK
jgi:hypothetical protein